MFIMADGQYLFPTIVLHKGEKITIDMYQIPCDWIINTTPSGYVV